MPGVETMARPKGRAKAKGRAETPVPQSPRITIINLKGSQEQADWLEAMYTLWYSKPHVRAVTWWDFADRPGHFWPFGGMLRKDMTPKESYGRLVELQKRWGVAKQA